MKTKIALALAIFVIHCKITLSQSPPLYDDNWELMTEFSDEFEGSQLDALKWEKLSGMNGWTYCPFSTNFVSVSNGNLNLKADYSGTSLLTAGIQSVGFNYRLGYLEIRAILPGYFNTQTNQPCNQGFWTSFWTYYQVLGQNKCVIDHNEIDIIELDGWNKQKDGRSLGGGGCVADNNCGLAPIFVGGYEKHNLSPLYQTFHKYACEWYPDKVIYYFDDTPIAIASNNPNIPNEFDTRVVIDNQLLQQSSFNSNTPWPISFTVDYFRYYRLNMDFL